jgi:predicted rRNA methylase YqxC with S4 and FtsJ domains
LNTIIVEDPGFDGVISDKNSDPRDPGKDPAKALLDENVHLWDTAASSPRGRKGNREYFFLLLESRVY